jgi:hypothetical protein
MEDVLVHLEVAIAIVATTTTIMGWMLLGDQILAALF